jgi:hypothetical protein
MSMILTINRVHIQGTSLALSRVEGAPHKPFGLEPLGIELEAEMLRAERFTPMPGVHLSLHLTCQGLRPFHAGEFNRLCRSIKHQIIQ